MGCASSKDAMSDSMGKAVWQAARVGNEAELRRLIGLGCNVNWHNPWVRRRMCLAWAPASSPPLPAASVALAADTALARDGAISPQLAARRAAALAKPPPRRPAELCTRVLVAPPRARPRSSSYGT
jgi:hypothetical protein